MTTQHETRESKMTMKQFPIEAWKQFAVEAWKCESLGVPIDFRLEDCMPYRGMTINTPKGKYTWTSRPVSVVSHQVK